MLVRFCLSLAAFLLLSLPAIAGPIQDTAPDQWPKMPMSVWHQGDGSVRLGAPHLVTGRYDDDLQIEMEFRTEGDSLGPLSSALLWVKDGLGPTDQGLLTQIVLTSPSGQVWRRSRSDAYTGSGRFGYAAYRLDRDPNLAGLSDALHAGGRFTVALQDEVDGRRWNETVLDIGSPVLRARLWSETRARFAATDPASFASPPVVVRGPPSVMPTPGGS